MLWERLINHRPPVYDPRVSAANSWILGAIGLAIVGGLGWGVNGINDLNKNVALLVQQNVYADRTNEAQEKHFNAVDVLNGDQEKRLRDLEQRQRELELFHARDAKP
jgi:hypothetical protein